MEWHAVGPQPAYKFFEDILIVLLGSIVVKEWVFLYTYFAILYNAYFFLCLTMMLSCCCVTKNIEMSLLFLLFLFELFPSFEFYLRKTSLYTLTVSVFLTA